jgi:NAD+ synthase
MRFSQDVLTIDTEAAIQSISGGVREHVLRRLHRRGAVVAVSGGIDSSVFLPERHSSPESLQLGRQLTARLGIPSAIEDIAPILEGAGCYARQLEAVRKVYPEFADGWKFKITLPSILAADRLNVSRLAVRTPAGEQRSERMPAAAYLQLVAATNFKQRTRTMMAYYHADRLNYAVCGTPNRLEYDQGFFVKGGDGLADFKPIAHLYKTQVYALARALGVPEEICNRTPTTDTFPLAQTQEEFYFALPYREMDLCLYAHNHGIPAADVAPVVGITPEQVERVFRDIEAKRRTTLPLHVTSLLVDTVPEIALHDATLPPGRGNGA